LIITTRLTKNKEKRWLFSHLFFIFVPLKSRSMILTFMFQIRGQMICKFCKGKCVKDGFQKSGCQRYKCKCCKKKQQRGYKDHACAPHINNTIIAFIKVRSRNKKFCKALKNISHNTAYSNSLNI
jgi:Insertion element protein.